MKDERRKRTSKNLESLMEKYRKRTRKILPEKRVFESIKDFTETHQELVKHIAQNYMDRGISLSELIKAGNRGLKEFTGKNERKFKKSMEMGKQYKMMSPSWWIRQAIMRALEVIVQLSSGAKLVSAQHAETLVPTSSGLYSIFIDDTTNLLLPFSKQPQKIIYLGKASGSLKKRLVEQDLRHKNSSTFFRSIGAVLGYRPLAGSLKGKKNQNNYKFSAKDTQLIIRWINAHLSIRWVVLQDHELESFESGAISSLRPLLNTLNNPKALPELAEKREKCRQIARGNNCR